MSSPQLLLHCFSALAAFAMSAIYYDLNLETFWWTLTTLLTCKHAKEFRRVISKSFFALCKAIICGTLRIFNFFLEFSIRAFLSWQAAFSMTLTFGTQFPCTLNLKITAKVFQISYIYICLWINYYGTHSMWPLLDDRWCPASIWSFSCPFSCRTLTCVYTVLFLFVVICLKQNYLKALLTVRSFFNTSLFSNLRP